MKIAIKGATVTIPFFLFLVFFHHEVESIDQSTQSTQKSNAVRIWAENFGKELKELAEIMTKADEIRKAYSTNHASVDLKNGSLLMESVVENIGRMLNRKMDAVKCIVNKSEEYAEEFHRNQMAQTEFDYYSSKLSLVNGLNLTYLKSYTDNVEDAVEEEMYRNMTFDRDSHFFDLNVNTSHSSVHVPTNVYDNSSESSEFIQWSEVLDEVFIQNYRTDPALSWQYFGSNLGIMRHYPALAWNRNKTDTYDCRKRNWYIETATCSKDVIVLFDNSGSMTGYRSYVAKLTMKYLLDTFSNNDFINVLKYSNGTEELVPCFADILVQATPENIQVFNDAVNDEKMVPEGNANVSLALEKAFQILETYREKRNCSDSVSGCNQAIMLVTDGVPGNATEVFERYNNLNSNQTSPVRVFTFLLGKEVTKVREIQLYACLNRGYYEHVQSLDEVAEGVLKYVNVIAAPLVLQKEERPPTWTHAYIDTTYETDSEAMNDDEDDFRLMIAVGVPAFNLSSYGEGNFTGRPSLLGVAGTDVPLEDLIKLALPYKIGVNGYSFIVSNNGYVLMHPDLRPYDKQQKQSKPNYNSIDFTEVEYFDENLPPRVPSAILKEIRENLVNHAKGSILNVSVLFPYDEKRRIAQTRQDYYFAPIPHTPFSLGIALPHDYGNTWIKVHDVINTFTSFKKTDVKIVDYFQGQNWKIHPDWVYCKFHYLEGHEANNSEDELIKFLKKIHEPDWKWSQQYEPDPDDIDEDETNDDELNCGRKSLDAESYYCNKELVELLVLDAKITGESYQSWEFKNDVEEEIVRMYNATVRFVATMSGLTRWQFIEEEIEVESDKEFGDFHSTAIEEPWYKSAILQHQINQGSFVYSVPHQDDVDEGNETRVTASMAIFHRDGGLEAPSCVVGFQFSLNYMYSRFMEITSKVNCDDCIKTCGNDNQLCYVIDNNGYVILSSSDVEVTKSGRFFGEVEQPVMEQMVEDGIFKRLVIYDLQGLCKNVEEINTGSSAEKLITPFKLILLGFKWMMTELFIEFSRIQMWATSIALPEREENNYEDYEDEIIETEKKVQVEPTKKTKVVKQRKGSSLEDEEWFAMNELRKRVNVTTYYPCDKKSELYVLQHGFVTTNSSRTFYAHEIPNSNLLLVVINKLTDNSIDSAYYTSTMTTEAIEMEVAETYNNVEFPCHKLYMNDLPRRRLTECFTEHEDEEETSYCGSSSRITQTTLLLLLPITATTVLYRVLERL